MYQSIKIFNRLFNDLDRLMSANMTGQKLAKINTDFYKILHMRKGQGAGGSWLSEYLVFACLNGIFGSRGKGKKFDGSSNLKYPFKNGIDIYPNHRLGGKGGIVTDFAIYRNGQVIAAIEVKTSPTSLKDLNDCLKKYREVHNKHSGTKVLMVIFANPPKKGKMPMVAPEEIPWLSVKYIGNYDEPFYNIIKHVKPD